MKNKIPKFKSLEEERRFWDNHSAADFLNELTPVKIKFIRPRKKLISLRLDTPHLVLLKEIAATRGIGYLTLMRIWILERLSREHQPAHTHHS